MRTLCPVDGWRILIEPNWSFHLPVKTRLHPFGWAVTRDTKALFVIAGKKKTIQSILQMSKCSNLERGL